MKQAEVEIGGTYYTRIGEELAPVVVVYKTTDYKGKTVFAVQRVEDDRILPKHRTAAALRKEKVKFW
jgi:hypothetical protein